LLLSLFLLLLVIFLFFNTTASFHSKPPLLKRFFKLLLSQEVGHLSHRIRPRKVCTFPGHHKVIWWLEYIRLPKRRVHRPISQITGNVQQ
jgi:hypothetical protein